MLLLHALLGASPVVVFAGIALVSALVGVGIASLYTFAAFAYPPTCRGSGVGITLMAGRAGGILSSFAGGILLSLDGTSTLPFFATLVGSAAFAALSVWSLGARYAVILKHSGDTLSVDVRARNAALAPAQ